MSDVTRILLEIDKGDSDAAEKLLPVVYKELRRLAAQKLAQEKPGQTLQATSLVHEAYLRLVDVDQQQKWDSRGHFFSAAAEAMRRILIENARRKGRLKHGGNLQRVDLAEAGVFARANSEELLAVDEALAKLEKEDATAAELVKLRYFAGLSIEEASDCLGIARATAYRQWNYARAWLKCALGET